MFKSVVFASALLLVPVAAQAVTIDPQITPADEKAIDARMEAFFKDVNAGHVDTALSNGFLPRMSTDNKTTLQGMTTQMQVAVNYAGLPLKSEIMSETVLASVLVARSYVVYSKDMPVSFKLIFFKTPDGWYIQSLMFQDFKAQDY